MRAAIIPSFQFATYKLKSINILYGGRWKPRKGVANNGANNGAAQRSKQPQNDHKHANDDEGEEQYCYR